jgi:hypothetical protein
MPVDTDGLLSAISSGIDEASAAPAAVETPPDDADVSGVDQTDASGENTEGAAASGNADGSGTDTAAAASGAPAGEKSTAAPAADAAGGVKGAAPAAKDKPAAPAADAAGLKPAKVVDPINDPIDERLKPATKERITSLVTTAKALTTERDQYKGQFEELNGYIAQTGASPEQYATALDYLRMVNSPNIADREQCLAFMQQEIKALAVSLGKPVPGVDLLSDHADLQQQVAGGGISQQHAEEIAAARAQRGQAQQFGQRQQAQQQQTAAQQQAVQAGTQQLNALGAELQAADPAGFAAKKAILVEALKPVFAQIPPSAWASTFRAAYTKLALPAAPRPVPKPAVPAAQPLRASNPAGGTAAKPTSMHEALWGTKG